MIDNCPKCKASFIGEPTPKDIVEHYAGTHWRKEIGIDGGRAGIYDGVVAYKCHECGHEFPCNDSAWAAEMFNKYLEAANE